MLNNKIWDIIFCILSVLIGLIIINVIELLDNNILKILLYPHKLAVEIFYNIKLDYINNIGYCSYNRSFAIGAECMGHKLFALIFIMLVCTFNTNFNTIKSKLIWLIISFIITYISSLTANCIRIIGSVPIVSFKNFVPLHSISGIAINFVTLILVYNLTKKFIRKC